MSTVLESSSGLQPEQRIAYRRCADLVPYARNSHTHSAEQVAKIAASIEAFGWTSPVLADAQGIVAGHGRVLGAELLYAAGEVILLPNGQAVPIGCVPVLDCSGWSEAKRRAYVIADNKLAEQAGWDEALLRSELAWLDSVDFSLGLLAFDDKELARLLAPLGGAATTATPAGQGDADAPAPEPPAVPTSKPGDIWLLGKHRVMCGDSTSAADVARLMASQTAALLHADPPYGMGKTAEGVANDNLSDAEFDRFQLAWWATFRPFLAFNASAYIWGNAPELWRLWYAAGLGKSEEIDFCNEIVWDKKSAAGMGWAAGIGYQTASERCLFFKLGKQYAGALSDAEFPAHWAPMLAYLAGDAAAAGVKSADVQRVCGCGMFSHWFSRSQFALIPEHHYAALAAAYPGHFLRPWQELQAEFAPVSGVARETIRDKLDAMRSYFDNTHDAMRDVWTFPRVTGKERHGHATPKPVAMMERVMLSSLPPDGLCVEPFGGSGSTLIAAQKSGRVCFTMELQPAYVDVIVLRWQELTGERALNALSGGWFGELTP